ncbi:MAG TPA: ABC transporter substrate-binding protein [Syntrophomonas sp.]|jgi:NitT/TauT family transport system substrate-binding protein|nr:ABC transporter substrate-binding protein [Syntrophomonas sp.]
MKRKKLAKILGLILAIGLLSGLLAGCSKSETPAPAQDTAVKKKAVIAYAGGTCEAPTFVAYHKGFFEEEGLEVELVQAGFEQLKLGLTAGNIDAAQANFAWFKPIEQGLNIKLTAGIHTGCIKAVTPADSGIKNITDLKGKTIGVDAIGGGPMIALSTKLRENGINPTTEVEWKAYPGPQLDEAIKKNEIQAYMTWDPFPTQAHDHNNHIYLLDIGADDPFKDNYCCFVGVNGDLVSKDPEKAAAITRALLKAAEWVQSNPQEAAQISLDNKYVGGDVELNAKLLGSYNWNPSIKQAQDNIKFYIKELKTQGILEAGTSEADLYKTVFAEVIPDYNGK